MVGSLVNSTRLIVMSSVVIEPLIRLAVKPSALINLSFLIYRLELKRRKIISWTNLGMLCQIVDQALLYRIMSLNSIVYIIIFLVYFE